MNIWVALGAVAALVLIVVLVGTRRPRRAEDELAQPIQQAAPLNAQSSLGALTGEPALQECLTWQDFRYTFDKTAPLPKEESIERPMNEIFG
jgi:hypothetical protein